MKNAIKTFALLFLTHNVSGQTGNVGIGTTTPVARLHVKDSSVLFSATGFPPAAPGQPPLQGAGRRMMWYADKAAFRIGFVDGQQWNKDNIGNYSFAAGSNVKAIGDAAIALGSDAIASGLNAIALGRTTIAEGIFSVAIGYQTKAVGAYSTAFGLQSSALGNFSTAFGSQTNALGSYSTAFGSESSASGNISTAFGLSSMAVGDASIAMGGAAKSNAQYSIAIGESVTANSWISTSLGRHNDPIIATASTDWITTEPLLIVGNGTASNDQKNALTIAKNGNVYIDPSNRNIGTLLENSLLFGGYNASGEGISSKRTATGNQYGLDFYTAGITRMSISSSGHVGIGNSTPVFPLNFSESLGDKISLFGNLPNHYGFGIQNNLLQIYASAITEDIAFGYGSSAALTETMRIKGNGKVGIGISNPNAPLAFTNSTGTKISLFEGSPNSQYGLAVQPSQFQLYTDDISAKISFGYYTSGVFTERMFLSNSSGILTVSGTSYPSDQRYKKQINPLQNPLERIAAINGVEYFMRTDEFPSKHFNEELQVGLIAQEVEKILPQAVHTNEDGYKSLDYARVVPLLVEGIKEQQKQIAGFIKKSFDQQEQIDALTQHEKKQQKELNDLKNLVKKLIPNN